MDDDDEEFYDEQLRALHAEHGTRVRAFLRDTGIPEQEAAALANEAFMATRVKWSEIQSENPIAYTYGVARKLRSKYFADRQKQTVIVAAEADRILAELDFEPVLTPEDLMDVHHALQRLPLRQREVVMLYYWESMKTREIAAVLGVAPGHVQRTLSDGRQRLRQILANPWTPKEEGK